MTLKRSEIVRLLNSWLFSIKIILLGYPLIKNQYLDGYLSNEVRGDKSLQRDVREYLKASRRHFPIIVFLAIVIGEAIHDIKYIFYACIVAFKFQNFNSSSSIEYLPYDKVGGLNKTNLRRFACLVTNCNYLSPTEPIEDNLARLPSFISCYPNLSQFYTPVAYLDHYGFASSLVASVGILVLGCMGPICGLVLSRENETMMFIVAPKLTRKIVLKEMGVIINGISDSLANFRKEIVFCIGRRSYLADLASLKFKLQATEKTEEQMDLYLPLVRSNWWHAKCSSRVGLSFLLVVSNVILISVYLIIFIGLSIEAKHEDYRRRAEYMRSIDCALWADPQDDNRWQVVDLEQLYVGWTLIASVYTFTFMSQPLLNLVTLTNNFYMNSLDLAVWVADLRARLVLLNEMTVFIDSIQGQEEGNYTRHYHHHHHHRRQQFQKSSSRLEQAEEIDSVLVMQKFMERFMKCTTFSGYFLFNSKKLNCHFKFSKSKLNSSLENEMFAISLLLGSESLDHNDGNDFTDKSSSSSPKSLTRDKLTPGRLEQIYLDFSTMTYVNLRLLILRVEQYGFIMTLVTLFAFLINIGLVITYIYVKTTIKGSNSLVPIVMLSLAWIMANVLILTASKFNANARKLHPLIWAMIARSRRIKSVPIQHQRLLWIKQVLALDDHGGLSYGALGIKITYVSIIQLMIWISSLFVLALKNDASQDV